MVPRPRISFGKIALRVGAVTREDLEKARLVREDDGGNLEEILVEQGSLTPDLAEFVRDAFVRACAVCEGCGRRTDMEERDMSDWSCKCGGTFVALEEVIEEEGFELDPALLQSETGEVSDIGRIEED